MDFLSPNSSRVSTVPNDVFVFAAIFALAHPRKMQNSLLLDRARRPELPIAFSMKVVSA